MVSRGALTGIGVIVVAALAGAAASAGLYGGSPAHPVGAAHPPPTATAAPPSAVPAPSTVAPPQPRPTGPSPTAFTPAPPPVSHAPCPSPPPATGALVDVGPTGIRWRVDVPVNGQDAQAVPIVGDGVAYADEQGHALAVDIATGRTLWNVDLRSRLYDRALTPTAFVVDELFAGRVTALDRRTGATLWSWQGPADGFLGDAVPVGTDGLALLEHSGATVVLDLGTGRPRWTAQRTVGAQDDLRVAAGNGLLVRTGTGRGLEAYDAETGEKRWDTYARDGVPQVAGGRVLVSASGVDPELDAFDATTGRLVWSARTDGFTEPLAAGSLVLVQRDRTTVAALATETGAVRWTAPGILPIDSPQSAADDTTIATLEATSRDTNGGHVVGRARSDGRVEWRVPTSGSFSQGPFSGQARDRLLATTVGGAECTSSTELTAVDLATGRAAWRASIPDLLSEGNALDDARGGAVVYVQSIAYITAF